MFIFDVNKNSILLLIFFYFSVTVDEYNVTLVSGVQGIGGPCRSSTGLTPHSHCSGGGCCLCCAVHPLDCCHDWQSVLFHPFPSSPPPPTPVHSAAIRLFFVSMGWFLFVRLVCFLDCTREWHYVVFVFLCPTYFSLHTLKVHPRCHRW